MITLYRANETNFDHNGLGALNKECKRAVVEEELNGLYTLTLEYPLKAKFGQVIKNQMVIKAPTPSGNQLFRVYRCEPSMGMLTVTCLHIFYDLAFNLVEDTNIVSKSAQAWLQQLSGAAQYRHPFRFFSDIPDVRGSRVVRKNLVEILLDKDLDNSFVSRFGGEIFRDNFDIHMKRAMGENRNYRIIHKKNLLGYKAKIDDSNVITRAMPIGFDGLLLPEKYIDSPRLGQYPFPRIGKVELPEVKAAVGEQADDEDALPLPEAQEQLRVLTHQLFGKIDTPSSSYEVDLIELSKTKEYKDFAALETVLLGDTVTVDHPEDGFSASAKVIKYLFDAMQERLEQIELGSFESRSSTNSVNNQRSIEREIEEVKAQVSMTQVAANGKNTIHRGVERPVKPLTGDLWYEPQGQSLVLKQWNGKDWVIIPISDQNLGNVNINNLSGNAIDIRQFRLSNGPQDVLFINQAGEATMNLKHLNIDFQPVATKKDLREIELTPGPPGQDGKNIYTSIYEMSPNQQSMYISDLRPAVSVSNPPKIGEHVIAPSGKVYQINALHLTRTPPQYGVGSQLSNLKGPQGERGAAGAAGPAGAQGPKGDPGKFEGTVGARNFIRDFGFEKNLSFSSYLSVWQFERVADSTSQSGYYVKATCTKSGAGGFYYRPLDLRGSEWQNKQMTFAVDVKTSRAIAMKLGGEAFKSSTKRFETSSTWQRFIQSDVIDYRSNYAFVWYTEREAWQVGDVVYLRDPQLEEGTVATTPRAAPEDLHDQLNAKADTVQTNQMREEMSLLKAEVLAKAAEETLRDWIKDYQDRIANQERLSEASEEALIESGRRLRALETHFGGLSELKTFIDSYMTSSNEGLVLGKTDGSTAVKVSTDRISMFSSGREVMYITNGVIHINNGIFSTSVQIGKFVEEQYAKNPDINVKRFIG